MKKTILIVALLFTSLSLFAQAPNWAWAKSNGGIGNDYGNAISTDAIGNIFATGEFSSPSIKFGGTTLINSGTNDIFIVKYDPNGNVIWAKSAGGIADESGYSISTDASGNVVVTGKFASPTIKFGSTTLINAGANDIFIVKYDPSGNVLWAKSAGGIADESGYSISTDASGNIVTTGEFDSPTINFGVASLTNLGNDDIFIAKYDPNGNVLWAKSAGGTGGEHGNSIAADKKGNIVITGQFGGKIRFGVIELTDGAFPASNNDFFVAKLDYNGNVIWAKNAVCFGYDNGNSIITDTMGNIIITGVFASPKISFDGISLTNTYPMWPDGFVVKYDTDGNVLWAKSAEGASFEGNYGLASDNGRNIYVQGNSSSPVITFNGTSLTKPDTDGGGYIVKYDPNGNLIWVKSASGISSRYGSNNLATDVSGGVVTTGSFYSSTISFGSKTLTNSSDSSDMFIAKLSSATGTGIEILSKEAKMLVSPNPFNNSTLIQLPESVQNADIIVRDLLGKKVIAKKFSGKEYLLEKGSMSPGNYFIQINDEPHQYPVTKIVVQ
jgi:ribosomal protein S11